MRRVVVPELLDGGWGEPQDITASLADLRRVNRWFGGIHTSVQLVTQAARSLPCSRISLLDVAAGSGDIALALQRQLSRRNLHLEITILDRLLSHLQNAPRPVGNDGWLRPPRLIAGDALALPFRDSCFDLVACALFAHHLEPDELILFVNEALRVSRAAVLINDLRRNVFSLALVYAGLPLFRGRMSWHDGLASVRRAYTMPEMREILSQTRAARIQMFPSYLFRMGIIVWKL
jgi:ubiquinone/menaquinone biosynthesis C-methylase UbiE